MSGQRENQIRWQQFSIRHRRSLEMTRDDSFEESRDNHDESFEEQTSTPKSKSRAVQKRPTTPRKARVQKPITPETETIITDNSHEHVQKSKTRAARRAIEPEITESPTESTKPKHRERRTDYWVQRDDKRRTAARTLKFQDDAE
jgi:hypothetical protein